MSDKTHLSACSININGIMPNSKCLLEKYNYEKKFKVLAVQETLTSDKDKLHFLNMNCISDTNQSKNRGAALYVSHEHDVIKLDHIAKISKEIDSAWGLVIINKTRYVIGSIYVKRNLNTAINEVMNLLDEAHATMTKMKASGVILLGDFNSRHVTWGDTKNDAYGNALMDQLDYGRFSICSAKNPTFLSVQGSSCIDFAIVSNNLTKKAISTDTDDEIELFSGAPRMGHIPFIFNLSTESSENQKLKPNTIITKLNIDKINWEKWSAQIEEQIASQIVSFNNEENPDKLWEEINSIFLQSTKTHSALKKTTRYSKPYWTAELTKLSEELRSARKLYKKRNTDYSLENLTKAKENFERQKQIEGKEFILQRTRKLNSAQAKHFWKEFNKMFKKKVNNQVEPLIDDKGNLITDSKAINDTMFTTFFEAKHLKEFSFDGDFCATVNHMYNQAIEVAEENPNELDEHLQNLNVPITLLEIEKCIKTTKCSGKSFDNMSFHPSMLKHLGKNALQVLLQIFNMCMSKGKWLWKSSEVIFLKKQGKDNYHQPGSYRPISITSYVGKLLERILANRIETFLIAKNLVDPFQEGFSKGKNSIRYLNRLNLTLHADKMNNLTILCLFIDFEKAFDSVWIKGLIYKLSKINIKGNILKVINEFLTKRSIVLNINGEKGEQKESLEYGLPQGSVLSPLLFRIFIMDIIEELKNKPHIDLYKFADDGTVKVSAPDTATCLSYFEELLLSITKWKRKWRLKINCQKNKTEVINFNTAENDDSLVPSIFKLDNEEIRLVEKTKVLGLTIDKNMNYHQHAEETLKILNMVWVDICKYSNREWGLNLHTMVQLIKTLFIPKLQYAGHIFISENNLADIKKLWYKLIKTSIGAVLNISVSVAEVILGVPPLELQTKINRIKHFLKLNILKIPGDLYLQTISDIYNPTDKSPSILHSSLKEVFHFLNWKCKQYPKQFSDSDKIIIQSSDYSNFKNLSSKACSYTTSIIKTYTEKLWSTSLTNQYQNQGYPRAPNPSCSTIPIPQGTPRDLEVKLLNLFYKNNITNSFLYKIGKAPSPMCPSCNSNEDTISHILLTCPNTSDMDKFRIQSFISPDEDVDEITTLSLSRKPEFIKTMINITQTHNFPSEVNINVNYI